MLFIKAALFILTFAVALGLIVAVPLFIILTVYQIPYALWIGSQNVKGEQLDKKTEPLQSSLKNATKLYKCWIFGKSPTL